MKPTVAIVGRPNVGKSTFFNRISGRRIAIVQDIAGVTRDRVLAEAEWCGKSFTIVDTGGLEPNSQDQMYEHIKRQAEIAMATSEVIVFFCDYRDGVTSGDYEIAARLRSIGKPVVLAVNKMDTYKPEGLYEFYKLGLGEPMGVSAEQGLGVGDVLDAITSHLPKTEITEENTDAIKIAFVGKPNAGKSSMVNRILGEERVIVSDIAGTTRDTIDTPITIDGKNYIIIDTAGLRRKRSVESGSVEAISAILAMKAIERADVVVIMVDATEGVMSEQDVRIAGYVHNEGKPSIIAVNKWDAIDKDTYTIQKYTADMDEKLKFMDYYKSVFVSALTGQRVNKLLETVELVYNNSKRRVSTGTLNEIIANAVMTTEPPAFAGRKLKIYYATQARVSPPTFVFFVNNPKLMHFSYERYLENCIRKAVDFSGTPIKLETKTKVRE